MPGGVPKYHRKIIDAARAEFPHLKSRIPPLSTNSCLAATASGNTLYVAKRYVENQHGK